MRSSILTLLLTCTVLAMAHRPADKGYGVTSPDGRLSLIQTDSSPVMSQAFLDGTGADSPWDIKKAGDPLPETVTCQPRGGFVMIVR